MHPKMKTLSAALLAAALALPAAAMDAAISVEDPYARASRPNAPSGAAFMKITNAGDTDDRLIAAASDIAERVELHTHLEDADGVMRMVEVEDGFLIPAGETHMLRRGGDHVMFMGLRQSLENGDIIEVTLTFENAGDMTVQVPVDLDRAPMAHGGGGTN